MTASYAAEPDPPIQSESRIPLQKLLPTCILIAAFIVRIIPASRLFLNPDEALHYLLASRPSIREAWAAALTNAHPPLLILVLYYWRSLGHSELWLRMPSVLAGTFACWLIYQWLKLVTEKTAAIFGLLLFSLAPSLISLSAEIRQYALLLFFESASLYFAERALQKNSVRAVILFSLSLYGALLTHYSALMFAFAIGIFMLVRLYPYGNRLKLSTAWGAGQLGGVAIATDFMLTHLQRLRQTGMVRADLESYLQKSIFHPGRQNPVAFVIAQTLRVFTYIFSHGLIGSLMFVAFLAGIVWLLRSKTPPSREKQTSPPSSRELALLLGISLLVSWAVAITGFYPLGATRHDAFLAPFLIMGASVGISGWIRVRNWTRIVAIVVAMAICNFFPAPPPPIRPQDQSRALMRDAASYLRASAPAGTTFLTDYESGLLLGYYLCGHGVVQVFPPLKQFSNADCGPYTVVAPSFRYWKFLADTFPGQFAAATKGMPASTEVWLFYAGWINDSAPALQQKLGQFGCTAPKDFGENIFICRLRQAALQQ